MKKIYLSFTAVLVLYCIFSSISGYSQIITTFAGGGSTIGDGTLAYKAKVDPNSVVLDTAGNIYIVDRVCQLIRKITASTGIITTVAGNGGYGGYNGDNIPAISAELNEPLGLALDKYGNIYIADFLNSRIRKVTVSTGIITTVAGNGTSGFNGDNISATSAQLFNPTGVAVDTYDNIYIADQSNYRIRKVTASTGIITTVAGNGTGGYNGDNIYATTAKLNLPVDVRLDASGNIYIADQSNNRIRKITASTGIITTIAGSGTAGFNGDNIAATSAYLNSPWGLAFDASNNLYIADELNDRIRKVNAITGIITTIAGNGAITYNGDNIPATNANLNDPKDVAIDLAGNVIICDEINNRLRKVTTSTGIITTIAGIGDNTIFIGDGNPATLAPLYAPRGIAIDSAGNIYATDRDNNRIRKITVNTGIINTVIGCDSAGFGGDGGLANHARLNLPEAITIDGLGNIYFSDNNRIRKVTASTNIITTIAGFSGSGYSGDGGLATSSYLNIPLGMASDKYGNIYIADSYNHVIRKITASTGIITTIAGNGTGGFSGDGNLATSAKLNLPRGIVIDTLGNIYIADVYNQRIRKVTASTGIITTIAGTGTAGYSGDGLAATVAKLYSPYGIALDKSNNIYIADTYNYTIRKISASTGIITTVVGNGIGGFSGDSGLATNANLSTPNSLAFDVSGNMYIGDQNNNRIRKVTVFKITSQPSSVTVCALANTSFSVSATSVISYQWQVNKGTGFVNLLDTGVYSGSTTTTLNITAAKLYMNGYYYRCKLTSGSVLNSDSVILNINPLPVIAGIITGTTTVCQGQGIFTYTILPITNATSYIWNLPNGVIDTTTADSLAVNYTNIITSGNITVKGNNSCGNGITSNLAITVNPLPANAGTITGIITVNQGQSNFVYDVPVIANANTYLWKLPLGAIGTSNTNEIYVDYSTSAVSGYLTVKGHNNCGDGDSSTLLITVNPIPINCTANFNIVADTTTPHHYFVVNNATGVQPLKYYWSWGDGTNDTIAYPTHTYSASGWYNICLSIIDSVGCTNNYCDSSFLQKSPNSIISITVIPQGTLGINETHLSSQIKVYPNPVNNEFTIEMKGNKEKVVFEIFNSIGQSIYKGNFIEKTTIHTSSFAPGIYIIKLNNGKVLEFKKIVKE